METYEGERECRNCDATYTAAVYVGVGRDTTDGMCRSCYEDSNDRYVERVLAEFPDVWYRPDSEEYEICVYAPDGDRRYFRHDLHAVLRIENWYDE